MENPGSKTDEGTDGRNGPGCGCKGVRHCALCADTPRVRALQDTSDGVDFGAFEPYAFCDRCLRCHRLDERREYSPDELTGALDALPSCSELESTDLSLEGLYYIPDFISPEEETHLVSKIDSQDWVLSQSGRRKQDFSPQVNFKKQKVKLERFAGVPDYSVPLIDRMAQHAPLANYQILELCNLEYDPARASSIEFHADDMWIWGERLISVNLLSGAVMSLIGPFPDLRLVGARGYGSGSLTNGVGTGSGDTPGPDTIVYVSMARRSLLAMAGRARYFWKHGILRAHLTRRRVALTMREPDAKFMPGGPLWAEYGEEMARRAKRVIPI